MKKSIKLFSLLASIALTGAVSPALAQTAAATPAATAAATPAGPTVTVDGLVDGYYSYNFTNAANNANGSGNVGYFYNNVDNSFTLGLAEAKVTATQGSASAHLVLAYGQELGLGIGTESIGTAVSGGVTTYTVTPSSGFDVLQAYVSYVAGQWTFNAGRFVTWLGNEVIESNSNWNYSHSLLFNYIPLWHTGLSVNFTPSSTFNITGYAVDGNNNTVASPAGKNYGLQAVIAPNAQWTITLNGLIGPTAGTAVVPNNDANNFTAEGIFSFKPDSMWSFALDAQAAGTNSTNYWGLALYGRDQVASDFAVALRLEDLADYGQLGFGNTSVAGNLYEGTLTLEHNFTANLLGRLEGRYDTNAEPTGIGTGTAAASIYAGGAASSQFTATASAVLSF